MKRNTTDTNVLFESREGSPGCNVCSGPLQLGFPRFPGHVTYSRKMKDAVVQTHPQVMSAMILTHVLVPDWTIVEHNYSSACFRPSRSFNSVK